MIHSLAGELGLDVYVISLSRAGLDDTSLSEIIADLPEKCIALMEDIDAAFHHGLNRDLDDVSALTAVSDPAKLADNAGNGQTGPRSSASRITLSGLLNALDGVGAQEGRILYATTNKYSALDPALCRPGRMDLHIEFKLASQFQAEELFRCFYLPSDHLDSPEDESEKDGSDSGYSSPATSTPEQDLIDLTSFGEKSELASLPNPTPTIKIAPSPIFTGSSHRARAPKLSRRQISQLANSFASSIPNRESSMAALQGYLMSYKSRPYEAVKEAPSWVASSKADKEKKNTTKSPELIAETRV